MELIERYAQFWEYTISGGVHRKPWCAPELVHTKIGGVHQARKVPKVTVAMRLMLWLVVLATYDWLLFSPQGGPYEVVVQRVFTWRALIHSCWDLKASHRPSLIPPSSDINFLGLVLPSNRYT